MRIERVDDKTVKCFLSNEELDEYEIDYKDFIMRSEKAKEVVQEIMEQAEEEVGYKPPKFAFDLQIMMLPDEGIILTFSEKEPADCKENEQIIECLKDVKELLQRAKGKGSVANESSNSVQSDANEQKEKSKKQEPQIEMQPHQAVFSFDKLSSVIEYASIMPNSLRVKSSLYCMKDVYYLHIQKGTASYERYSRACIQAVEFGRLYAIEPDRMLHLQEHGECLIEKQALKKLCVISG